jgi:hypothetical protein
MTKVVDLKTYRLQAQEKRSFGPWQKRFSESYDSRSRLSDISDQTLYYLSQPGENSSSAYYEIIMGILDLGSAVEFHYLDNPDQMRVVDIHLFLADQLRLEMMRRLGWVRSYGGRDYSLLEMVQEFDTIKNKCREHPPDLARSNTNYSEYAHLTDGDKEVFIRRMLQEALDSFKKRI